MRPDAAPLRSGDRLVFEWVSTLGGEREVAELAFQVDEVGTPGAPRDLPDDAIEMLERLTDLWNEANLGVSLHRDGGDATLDVPTGVHGVSVTVRRGTEPEGKKACEFPIACEGRGLLPAGERIRARLVGDRATLSTQELISVCVDGMTLAWLGWAPSLFETLPGMRDLDELVEKPSWLRWLFSSWSVQFPIWSGVRLHDGRVQVPLVVRCGSKDVLMGLVELAPPEGLLCLSGGITGLRLWRPTDPAKELRMRLVRNERGVVSPSVGGM